MRGGKAESTGGKKLEAVGAYVVNAAQAIAIDAGAAVVLNVAGSMKQNIGKSHGITASGAAAVTVSKLKLDASGKITLKCGQASVVIGSDGVEIKGALKVTIEASGKLDVTAPDIAPG